MKNFKLDKPMVFLLAVMAIFFFVDFSQRILVLDSEQKRDFVYSSFKPFTLALPYRMDEINALSTRLRQSANSDAANSQQAASTIQNARQFGDLQLSLLAIYTKGEFTALFRFNTEAEPTPKLIRLKQGEQLQHVTIAKIERDHVTIQFAGEDSVFTLFRSKQTNSN
jgi:hypothetical protein